jgi:O-acetyl-ADP-ribose deacetylase (regulator of RNase III)
MKIEYRTGNLLDVDSGIIAHGCNARGVMGSGVAKYVRDKYPLCYEKYKLRCQLYADPKILLGDVIWYEVPDKRLYVANAITQLDFGADGKRYVSYEAVDKAFYTINKAINDTETLHIPMIGAGLGGGDWEVISSIIEANVHNANNIICWTL